jgi:hypothetical protein
METKPLSLSLYGSSMSGNPEEGILHWGFRYETKKVLETEHPSPVSIQGFCKRNLNGGLLY